MKAAPDLHKKRAERGGRKREGGGSERRAGRGTTSQPSAGGTAQSTDLHRCTPLQDQYAKAHRRSRSKAAHPPARFGPAASPRVARGAAKAGLSPWRLRQRSSATAQGMHVLPARPWSRGAQGSAAPTPKKSCPALRTLPRGKCTENRGRKVWIHTASPSAENLAESVTAIAAIITAQSHHNST